MSWWGKVVGGTLGFMMGGPLGALLGLSLGHSFDSSTGRRGQGLFPGDQERTQAAFFTATFSVMGHMAKADGRVSPQEISLAEMLIKEMRLDGIQRKDTCCWDVYGCKTHSDCASSVGQIILEGYL